MSVHSAARSDEYEIFEGDIDEHKVRIFVRKTQAPRGDLTMRTPTFSADLCRAITMATRIRHCWTFVTSSSLKA